MATWLLGKAQDAVTRAMFGAELTTEKTLFYQLVDKDMNGNEVSMKSFEGNVLCIVNVACECGLTSKNYTDLTKLADEYSPRGFKVLVFPCNQFGRQEPGSHEDILNFADQFGSRDKFTFFEKGQVNGKDTREVFSFLKQKLPSDDGSSDIRWNFAKFLVDHEGNPYKRYSPMVPPFSMKEDIEVLLRKKEGTSSE